jgi:SAM-dependent methyltransferase
MFRGISHQYNLLRYAARTIGPGRMVVNSLRWATDNEARCVDSGFDEAYGTDTNAEVTPCEARIPAERRRSATIYLPTMDQDLESLLDALDWSPQLIREASFVDLGSGKGRAVFLAAMRRFRQVIGVELSPVLHQVATANLEVMRESGALVAPVRFVQGDATEYEVPEGPVVTYLYHPFREPIAEQAIGRLVSSLYSNPRPAAVLYCHPTLQTALRPDVFESHGVFGLHAEGARKTRRFQIGWTIWTNHQWLAMRAAA